MVQALFSKKHQGVWELIANTVQTYSSDIIQAYDLISNMVQALFSKKQPWVGKANTVQSQYGSKNTEAASYKNMNW